MLIPLAFLNIFSAFYYVKLNFENRYTTIRRVNWNYLSLFYLI